MCTFQIKELVWPIRYNSKYWLVESITIYSQYLDLSIWSSYTSNKHACTYKSKLHKNTKTARLWLNIGDIMDLDIVRCFTWHPEVIIFYAKCKSNISLSEGLPTNYDECAALAELHPELSHVGVWRFLEVVKVKKILYNYSPTIHAPTIYNDWTDDAFKDQYFAWCQ